MVVAETFEQARAAASPAESKLHQNQRGVRSGSRQRFGPRAEARASLVHHPQTKVGDFDGAFASAPVKLDETYTTPDQSHAMMEPHATIAKWDGDKLTCWCSIQQLNWGARDVATILGIPKENIRLISAFIGGGFGGKGTALSDIIMASLAAQAAGRPVKVALPRPLIVQ